MDAERQLSLGENFDKLPTKPQIKTEKATKSINKIAKPKKTIAPPVPDLSEIEEDHQDMRSNYWR